MGQKIIRELYRGSGCQRASRSFRSTVPTWSPPRRSTLLALRSRSTSSGGIAEVQASQQSLIDSAKRRLLLWDITEEQIAVLEKTGKTQTEMTIDAPLNGIVLEKMVLDGAYITPGMNLYKIADLSTVWIIADVYEYEVPLVKVGQQVRVTLPYSSGEALHATVSFINPVLDPMTRTVKVRIAVQNPGLVLKPDMFVNVEIMISSRARLVIPRKRCAGFRNAPDRVCGKRTGCLRDAHRDARRAR